MSHQKPKGETQVAAAAPTKPAGQRDPRSGTDQVKQDGVMKEMYKKEELTRQNWETKWGFMKNPRSMWVDEAGRRGLPPAIFSGRGGRKVQGSSWGEWKLENIKIKESGRISEKSSGVIGWRSSVKENDYNRLVGPLHVSTRLTMNPPLSADEPDPNKQRVIFLG